MTEDPTGHPGAARLRAFARGRLKEAEAAEVARHLAGCTACRAAVEAPPADDQATTAREAPSDAGDRPTKAYPAGPVGGVPAGLVEHPRYRVVSFLGAGGMGAVYQAEHRLMERTVALKVLNRGLTDSPDAVERFRREVKA